MIFDVVLEQIDAASPISMTTVPLASDANRAPRIKPRRLIEIAGFAIFGRQADRGGVQAEVGNAAEDQHPGPHENVDAVFKAAHPAGEHDLRNVQQAGAEDANGKSDNGVALGLLAFAVR